MPGQPGSEHHLHLACRRGHGAQLQDRSACGFARQMLRALGAGELIEAGASAAAGRALGGERAVFGDDEDVEPAQRLRVAGESAVGSGDENPAQLFAVAGAHLHDARIEGARGAIGAQNQLEARGEVEIESAERHGIEIGAAGVSVNPCTGCLAGPEAMSAAVRAACSRRSGLRLSV